MKTKQVIYAVLWGILYILATYFFWKIFLPFVSQPKTAEDQGTDVGLAPFEIALGVWWCLGLCGAYERINPKNPNLAAAVITVGTIISPLWWVPIGIVWLAIKSVKSLILFFKTSQFAIR
ncbi:MAG: hypothetical protein AAB477_02585 [Patescibacteria group bacterium]